MLLANFYSVLENVFIYPLPYTIRTNEEIISDRL
jgi:hypothetical protein